MVLFVGVPCGTECEPAAPGGVVAEELLERGLAGLVRRGQLEAEHEQPVEARARLLWREVDREPHSGRDGALEVDHPPELVGHEQVAALGVDRPARVGGRVGPDVERQRDDAADRLEHLLAAGVAEHDEALGEVPHLRRLRPRVLLRRRVGREDEERGRERDLRRSAGSARLNGR